MKSIVLDILKEYLHLFPEENKRQEDLIAFLQKYENEEITDWNNFDGHIVAGGFIYSQENNKFLVLYHNDLKMFLYPGGHITPSDSTPLYAAQREVYEETGLSNLKLLSNTNNELVPIDIDTHLIEFNERLNLPKHYHFDFRYLFTVDKASDIKIDTKELSSYKWIDIDELRSDPNYGKIAAKIQRFLLINK